MSPALGLPAHDLVEQGLADLARGMESVPALLVAIGAPRLRRLGLPVPDTKLADPEHRLYQEQLRAGRGMRELTDAARLRRFMQALGAEADRSVGR